MAETSVENRERDRIRPGEGGFRPLEAWRALRALSANPDDTAQVFRIVRALPSGNRVYRRKEIKLIHLIRHLLHTERYTIEGARQKLEELRKEGKISRASRIAWSNETVRDLRQEADELVDLLDI